MPLYGKKQKAWLGKQWRTVTSRAYAEIKRQALDALKGVIPKGVPITEKMLNAAVSKLERTIGINPSDPTGSWNWKVGDLTGRRSGKYEGRQLPMRNIYPDPSSWLDKIPPLEPVTPIKPRAPKRPRGPSDPGDRKGEDDWSNRPRYDDPRAPPEPMDIEIVRRVLRNVPVADVVTGPVRKYSGKFRLPPYASYAKQYTRRARRS